jgi:hypothetical protein
MQWEKSTNCTAVGGSYVNSWSRRAHVLALYLCLAANVMAQECPVRPLTMTGFAGGNGDQGGRSAAVSRKYRGFWRPGDDTKGVDAGAIYISEYQSGTWSAPTPLLASDGAAGDSFGIAVAISGNTIVVGAPGDDDAASDAGSVYVFERLFGNWFQTAKPIPVGLQQNSRYGDAVAIDGNILAASTTGPASAAAYVY